MRATHTKLLRLCAAGALVGAFASTPSLSAEAQPKAEAAKEELTPTQQAKALYGEAQTKFKAGDFAGALPLYQKADSIYPGPAPKYRIAVCHDKLGQPAEAIAGYQAFIDANPPENYADRLIEAKKRVTELEASLPATVVIKVSPAGVAGLQVTVDGQPVAGTELSLPPGQHTIVVSAEGYQPTTESVALTGRERRELAISLVPAAAAPPLPPPPTDAPAPAEPRSNVPAYVTLGIAGAGAILGTVFGIQSLSAKSDFDAEPTVDNADSAERAALIADMSFGVALTFGITGAVLLFSSDDADAGAEQASVRPTLTPFAGPKGGGMAATWKF